MSPVCDPGQNQPHLNRNRRFTLAGVNERVFPGPTSEGAEPSAGSLNFSLFWLIEQVQTQNFGVKEKETVEQIERK